MKVISVKNDEEKSKIANSSLLRKLRWRVNYDARVHVFLLLLQLLSLLTNSMNYNPRVQLIINNSQDYDYREFDAFGCRTSAAFSNNISENIQAEVGSWFELFRISSARFDQILSPRRRCGKTTA